VIDLDDIERLVKELLLAAAAADVIGMKAVFVAVDEMDDEDRSLVLAHLDGLAVRAITELADEWDVTLTEALRRLTERRRA
jgi:F0F1-type ATP synthase beta subunit